MSVVREIKTAIALRRAAVSARHDRRILAHAVTAGAIEELLVDLDAVIPGFVIEIDGSVTYAASDDAEVYSVGR